jgi:histone H3/H4
MAAVARAAREGGVKAVSESVYPYLSLAAEAYLVQLLHSLAKMRLQREDLGK